MNIRLSCAVLALAALGSAAPTLAQKTPDQLRAQRAEKLAKPVFKAANWILDYDKAREQAKKDGKLLLTYFTRSYSP